MKTILIIDDDELCRLTTAEYLRTHEWNVLEADNGDAGIELAIQHHPDVILSDLLMPRGNGYGVCRAVRAREDLRETRLVVMSGRDYAVDRANAKEAGADHYLLKPVILADLLQAVATPVENGQYPAAAAPAAPIVVSTPIEEQGGQTVLRFWGVRGSIPTPGKSTLHFGGNTSCVEVRADGELIIMDAGSGIRELGIALSEEFRGVALKLNILITHTHWDHIQGFPFFRAAYNPKNQLSIYGYEGAAGKLAGTLAAQMESPYFPIPLNSMPGHISIMELKELEFQVGAVRVTACYSKHPGVCVGFRLHTSAGSIVYLPDNEWSVAENAMLNSDEPCALEKNLLAFLKDADVALVDSQYDEKEYAIKKGWGHGCVDEVARLAMTAGIKHLFLFHHDPEHNDEFITTMLERAREIVRESGSTLQVDAAREGLRVVLQQAKA